MLGARVLDGVMVVRDCVLVEFGWSEPYFELPMLTDLKGRHVFIFGVWGRSSTTALQRILNSTGAICIWGEPGQLLMDDLLAAHAKLQDDPRRDQQLRNIQKSFDRRDHTLDVSMAHADWRPALSNIRQAILSMLAPVNGIQRFGYKEINVRGPETHAALRGLFPNSEHIFLFRDPVEQWKSTLTMAAWRSYHDLDSYLEVVERNALAALEADGIFLENRDVRDEARLRQLVEHLGLPAFDLKAMRKEVIASKRRPQVAAPDAAAIQARLGKTFEMMCARRDAFFSCSNAEP